MSDTNSSIVLLGFLIIIVCQDVVAVKAIKKNVREGFLCAIVPGYILIYASRDETKQIKPVIGWIIGFTLFLFGLIR